MRDSTSLKARTHQFKFPQNVIVYVSTTPAMPALSEPLATIATRTIAVTNAMTLLTSGARAENQRLIKMLLQYIRR